MKRAWLAAVCAAISVASSPFVRAADDAADAAAGGGAPATAADTTAVIVTGGGEPAATNAQPETEASVATSAAAEAPVLADGVYARFKTRAGSFTCMLEFEKAPLTVCNFVGLAEGTLKSIKPAGVPFFNGLVFHRVVKEPQPFVIQGGCPMGNGMGGPGYKFPDEISPAFRHDRPGLLSMANSGRDTNGSQFFVTLGPAPWLDGRHAIFGHVVDGMDVVNAVVQGDPIESVAIVRVGEKAKAFKPAQATFESLVGRLLYERWRSLQPALQ